MTYAAANIARAALIQFVDLNFAEHFELWFSQVKEIVSGDLTYTIGNRYIRLILSKSPMVFFKSTRKPYGFIDKAGNIFLAAGWSGPKKYVRGSIFSGKFADGAGRHSVLHIDKVTKKVKRRRGSK